MFRLGFLGERDANGWVGTDFHSLFIHADRSVIGPYLGLRAVGSTASVIARMIR